MSAHELRQAAETLRGLARSVPFAKAETSCAWESGHAIQRPDGTWMNFAPTTYDENERGDYQAAALFTTAMHPGVGLALADWLDDAASWEGAPGTVNHDMRAHDIARLINEGAS